ncbi:MAG TPA: hypothetical protein DCQ83_00575 [Fibrobacteres bacterium]|jgi:AcrR family transcriptional regulator|nr:hypothetical protein [Fibrobacterota bacterium]
MTKKSTPPESEVSAQEKILDAARAEFIAKGFKSARMQAIAKSAGVNHALLHYYFRSKEKLYDAAVRETVRTVWSGLQRELQSVPTESDFETLILTLLKTHARILSRHPDFPLFFIRGILEDGGKSFPAALAEILESFGEVPRRVNQALIAEIKAGRLRPIEPVHFWLNLVGMVISGFMASNFAKRLGPASPLARIKFTEKFFLERAEMATTTLLRSLRP